MAKTLNLNVRLTSNAVSNGRSAAANVGVIMSTGKYVIILDDDDFPHPDFFQKAYDFLSVNPDYAGVACWVEAVLEQVVDSEIINCGTDGCFSPTPDDLSILGLHTRNFPPCSFVLDRSISLK